MRIIDNRDLSRRVLSGKEFRTFALADGYRELSQRFGHDFDPAITLIERLPTFVSGDAHKQLRRRIASANARSISAQLAAVADFLADFSAGSLLRGGELDLMAEFSIPLFRVIGQAAIRHHDHAEKIVSTAEVVPSLFSTFTPLKRRLEINELVRSVLSDFGDDVLDDLALLVLGARPLTGALALSLHAVFRQNPGIRSSQIDWPTHFKDSPLQYVDRIALNSVSIGKNSFTPGERVRCTIQSEQWSDADNQSLMFGTGSHLCLGRALAERVWAMVAAMFVSADCRMKVGDLVMSGISEPFSLPASAIVSVVGPGRLES